VRGQRDRRRGPQTSGTSAQAASSSSSTVRAPRRAPRRAPPRGRAGGRGTRAASPPGRVTTGPCPGRSSRADRQNPSRAARYPASAPGSGHTKTEPSPSTASPVNSTPPGVRKARWSGAWSRCGDRGERHALRPRRGPGQPAATTGTNAGPAGAARPPRAAPHGPRRDRRGRGSPRCPRAPPRAATCAATSRTWPGSAGPGSTTQQGARPTSHVLVPESVNRLGLPARTSATSWTASGSAMSGPSLARA
jgi:hypothetical protein